VKEKNHLGLEQTQAFFKKLLANHKLKEK